MSKRSKHLKRKMEVVWANAKTEKLLKREYYTILEPEVLQ